jgi:2-keto-3-deoxy-galactonokinase
MKFREHTELSGKSRNTANMSSITHPGERNGWSQIDQDQMDCGQQWMAASD